jgi:hypothetical protein
MLPRGRTYGPEVDDALRVASESLDYICADRLTPNLVWMATCLAAHGGVDTSPLLLEQLKRTCVRFWGDLVQGVILSRCPSGRQNRRE